MKTILVTIAIFFIQVSQSSAVIYCLSNDQCPNKKACVGARNGSVRCIDNPLNSGCSSCKLSTSNYKVIQNGSGVGYDMDCLEKTSLTGVTQKNGVCQIDSLTEGICHTNKLIRNGIARYLVLFAVVVIGFNFIVGGGKVNINSIMILLGGIFLMYGGYQIINIITGVNAAGACQ